MRLLNRSQNFAIEPIRPPIEDLIIDLKLIAQKVSYGLDFEEKPEKIRSFESEAHDSLVGLRRNTKKSKHLDSLKSIREKEVVIMKADIGNKVVVMLKADYDEW